MQETDVIDQMRAKNSLYYNDSGYGEKRTCSRYILKVENKGVNNRLDMTG